MLKTSRNDDLQIRAASPDDAQSICEIYNQGIEDRIATLETRLRTPEEQRQWLLARSERHPVIVGERGGQIIGWGSLNSFNPRSAYDCVADFSIYVERAHRGKGVGRQLLEQLFVIARALRYHKLVLAMFPTNAVGLALYRGCGFREVGTYREQGKLDGAWVDVLIMEKLLE
jgi:L-amino acid N-acyltransferase YncA